MLVDLPLAGLECVISVGQLLVGLTTGLWCHAVDLIQLLLRVGQRGLLPVENLVGPGPAITARSRRCRFGRLRYRELGHDLVAIGHRGRRLLRQLLGQVVGVRCQMLPQPGLIALEALDIGLVGGLDHVPASDIGGDGGFSLVGRLGGRGPGDHGSDGQAREPLSNGTFRHFMAPD